MSNNYSPEDRRNHFAGKHRQRFASDESEAGLFKRKVKDEMRRNPAQTNRRVVERRVRNEHFSSAFRE
jgi:outer membrane receptor for monomeric catechols